MTGPDPHFGGKVCVVTGAASGIGFAVSEALLRAGGSASPYELAASVGEDSM